MAFILVVNHLSAINQLCKVHLERAGHTVTSLEDGNTAFELAQTVMFDLVIASFLIPGCNGAELYGKLRTNPRTREVPFLLFPIKQNYHTREEARELNSALLLRHAPLHRIFFLVSPFNPRILVTFVNQVLHGDVLDGTFHSEYPASP